MALSLSKAFAIFATISALNRKITRPTSTQNCLPRFSDVSGSVENTDLAYVAGALRKVDLSRGIILVSNSASVNFGAQLNMTAAGTAPNQTAGFSFYPTFGNFPQDTSPRRCADLIAGFDGTWGSQWLDFCVGQDGDPAGGPNDNGRLTMRAARIFSNRNWRIGNTTTDSGHRLQVEGSLRVEGKINASALPTSSVGLSAGDIWNDAGTLRIV